MTYFCSEFLLKLDGTSCLGGWMLQFDIQLVILWWETTNKNHAETILFSGKYRSKNSFTDLVIFWGVKDFKTNSSKWRNRIAHSLIITGERLIWTLTMLTHLPGGIFKYLLVCRVAFALFSLCREWIIKSCPCKIFPNLSLQRIKHPSLRDNHTVQDAMLVRQHSVWALGKSLGSQEIGRQGWISQYLPRLGGARIQSKNVFDNIGCNRPSYWYTD